MAKREIEGDGTISENGCVGPLAQSVEQRAFNPLPCSSIAHGCGPFPANPGLQCLFSRLPVPDRHSPEWIAHRAARVRCSDPRSAKWPAYGARGIRVCDAWIGPGGFARFFAHIGPRPTSRHSLDRVDNDRGYEPGNVRWAAIAQQQSNRRDNRRIEHGGETMTLSEWARRAGIKPNTLFRRLQHGWTMERALQAPSPALANRRRGVSP